jgi:hypothetical protein
MWIFVISLDLNLSKTCLNITWPGIILQCEVIGSFIARILYLLGFILVLVGLLLWLMLNIDLFL